MELPLPTIRDADAQALVDTIAKAGMPSLASRGVEGARAYLEERSAAGSPGPAVAFVEDTSFDGVPVRVYRDADGPDLPVVVYLHGGGWVIGSVASSDAFCRRLAVAAGCVLMSVDYPLAPENPYPAAVNAAMGAIAWAAQNASAYAADPARLIVLGDSAGGNLGTVAVRKSDVPVRRQILAYPGASDQRGDSGNPFAAEWPLLDSDRSWFAERYAGDPSDPDVSPLLADLTGLPPTTLLLGGADPLLAEGIAYAGKLWASGVSVDLHVFSGQFHGFLTMDPAILPHATEAVGLVANSIRSA